MSGAILLTGATGFLGMETLARLIDGGNEDVVVMVRARDGAGAQERLAGVLASLYDEPPVAATRVRAVCGDLLEPGLGLSDGDRAELLGSVDRIIHCAASISFDLPLSEAREINVEGVARIIELARELTAAGRLRRLVHVSTAYVSGRHVGSFGEEDLDVGQVFRNTYERSKSEAEQLLGAAVDLPLVIARPSIVVGHRASGWTPAFNVIYWPMRAFERGLLDEVPARPDSIVDFIPVDYVTDGILALLEDGGAHGAYNLVAGELALSAGELVELHASLAGRPPVRFLPERTAGGLPAGAEAFVPYFDVACRFADARAGELLGRAGVVKPDPRDILESLLGYARGTGWGKRPISRQASFAQKTGVSV
jgi:nucleoside-diphosphate-sugar epimerase